MQGISVGQNLFLTADVGAFPAVQCVQVVSTFGRVQYPVHSYSVWKEIVVLQPKSIWFDTDSKESKVSRQMIVWGDFEGCVPWAHPDPL